MSTSPSGYNSATTANRDYGEDYGEDYGAEDEVDEKWWHVSSTMLVILALLGVLVCMFCCWVVVGLQRRVRRDEDLERRLRREAEKRERQWADEAGAGAGEDGPRRKFSAALAHVDTLDPAAMIKDEDAAFHARERAFADERAREQARVQQRTHVVPGSSGAGVGPPKRGSIAAAGGPGVQVLRRPSTMVQRQQRAGAFRPVGRVDRRGARLVGQRTEKSLAELMAALGPDTKKKKKRRKKRNKSGKGKGKGKGKRQRKHPSRLGAVSTDRLVRQMEEHRSRRRASGGPDDGDGDFGDDGDGDGGLDGHGPPAELAPSPSQRGLQHHPSALHLAELSRMKMWSRSARMHAAGSRRNVQQTAFNN